MSSQSSSRPSSPIFQKEALVRSSSFRSASPTKPIQIELQIPNHPHLHIHTIRSPLTSSLNSNNNNNVNPIYDDDVSPPSSISAQILAPFLNAPVPSSFKSTFPSQTSTVPNGSGHQSRGTSARANALGSLSRSSSLKRNSRRSNEDNYLTAQYLELIGDGKVDSERLDKIRCIASERGIPQQLRRVYKTPPKDIR